MGPLLERADRRDAPNPGTAGLSSQVSDDAPSERTGPRGARPSPPRPGPAVTELAGSGGRRGRSRGEEGARASDHLEEALAAAADVGSARVAIERLVEGRPELESELRASPIAATGAVALVDASRSLTEAAVRDPAVLAPLRDPDALRRETAPEAYRRGAPLDVEGLRHWKQAELARIALRDLLGFADLDAVGRELAALADACLGAALALAEPTGPLAVVGMGKLGGRELNYASDVDVLFLHEGDQYEAVAAARRLLTVMTEPTAGGIVFRTDADLRPEGRSGALSRTVPAYAGYYESWAGHWERQALIKSRFVAGDGDLANAFFDAVLPLVWDGALDHDALREIRAMKARSEALRAKELKRGPGGIRDVEFAVQLLQLSLGRHDPAIRSGTTLEALSQLARGGYVDGADAEHLATAYRYLRTVEHRLQLREEQQVYVLPEHEVARTRLARVLGYRDTAEATALEQFEATHRRHQASVRSIHERLFFRPLLDSLAGSRPLDPESLGEQLAAFGFRDRDATRAAVTELTTGMSRTATQFRQLFPLLLAWLSATPNPDLGVLQLRTVADGPVRASAVVGALRDSPVAGERLCLLLGSSKVVGRALRRHPDALADLADDEALARPATREALVAESGEALAWRAADPAARSTGLRRFVRRHELRVASRDLLGFTEPGGVGAELTALAEATLERALASVGPPFPFVVVGLGKLGGGELGYASDLDIFFVHDGHPLEAERVAEALVHDLGDQTSEGRAYDIDTRLRPEGRSGALALTLGGFRSYWSGRAQIWERQAMLRARPVAGDDGLGASFAALRAEVVHGSTLEDAAVREIRRIKVRVERERVKPADDPTFHLKLGPGALADVEWTVQLLQLRHGHEDPGVRSPSTMAALTALTEGGYLAPEDAEHLRASYRFCERARDYRYLHTATSADSLPSRPEDAVHLARMLGFVDKPESSLREAYLRVTRRSRRVVERVFYGEA
ncbi:MAG: bifunctional [glutamine synthetase] adenylyltransferase/[glutamine synthetase]-adenylyl-L-tyrosine phosphorylase [Acidimicrobiia bacterium]|nr:bifunctional [glutamine synthetase] adenylyltransferase/[glutamine synthetase]-adenylyl-L-tyrosine phosphorylase [Acidimicrobiia bacterium]